MAKPYYADYVNHMLRFYFRYNRSKGFKNDVDKINYLAADKVITRLPDYQQDWLFDVFNGKSISFNKNVALAADRNGVDKTTLWSILTTVTTKIAKERKLL